MRLARLGRWLGVGLALAAASPAWSIHIRDSGAEAWLVGSFDPGDEVRFQEFLSRPRATPLRVIYLNSYGGNLKAGVEIGRMVRRAGLATAVFADRNVCDSACTLVFAGGVRRHNINGHTVHEGLTSMMGLGFHPAHMRGNSIRPSMLSDKGTEQVRAFYVEMGMPRAADLMMKAAINSMYRPSGKTTLDTRIATSLSAP